MTCRSWRFRRIHSFQWAFRQPHFNDWLIRLTWVWSWRRMISSPCWQLRLLGVHLLRLLIFLLLHFLVHVFIKMRSLSINAGCSHPRQPTFATSLRLNNWNLHFRSWLRIISNLRFLQQQILYILMINLSLDFNQLFINSLLMALFCFHQFLKMIHVHSRRFVSQVCEYLIEMYMVVHQVCLHVALDGALGLARKRHRSLCITSALDDVGEFWFICAFSVFLVLEMDLIVLQTILVQEIAQAWRLVYADVVSAQLCRRVPGFK